MTTISVFVPLVAVEFLSDGNQLATALADGRTGIYLATVPEPGLALLALPALAFSKRRRRQPWIASDLSIQNQRSSITSSPLAPARH